MQSRSEAIWTTLDNLGQLGLKTFGTCEWCDDLGMQERLSLNECRKLIGPQAEGASDEELTSLRDGMYNLSNTLVDAYADFRNRAERLDSDATIAVDLVLLALKEKYQDDAAWEATESNTEPDSSLPGSQQWDWETL